VSSLMIDHPVSMHTLRIVDHQGIQQGILDGYQSRISIANSSLKDTYGVATISRLLKIIGLFCKRALQKRGYSAHETYTFKEPTNRSHPIPVSCLMVEHPVSMHTLRMADHQGRHRSLSKRLV